MSFSIHKSGYYKTINLYLISYHCGRVVWDAGLAVGEYQAWIRIPLETYFDKALHQLLTLLLIWTLLPNFTFYLIARGFHKTFATGAAFKQRTITPPDTWSCPILGCSNVETNLS